MSFQPILIPNLNYFLMKSECTDDSFDVPAINALPRDCLDFLATVQEDETSSTVQSKCQ